MPDLNREFFASAYERPAPWDIHRPQDDVVHLEESGAIIGSVLDAGCGTGETSLYLAARGHDVWGVDFVPAAVDRAKAKAHSRGLNVHFQVADALTLGQLGRLFDTVIDVGLFHVFDDDARKLYVDQIRAVVRPGGVVHVLCFSDREPPGPGPRRVSESELRESFADGFDVKEIRPSVFATAEYEGAPVFSPGGPHAWVASFIRKGDAGAGN
jgi:SAM-dependent methyltransferase